MPSLQAGLCYKFLTSKEHLQLRHDQLDFLAVVLRLEIIFSALPDHEMFSRSEHIREIFGLLLAERGHLILCSKVSGTEEGDHLGVSHKVGLRRLFYHGLKLKSISAVSINRYRIAKKEPSSVENLTLN